MKIITAIRASRHHRAADHTHLRPLKKMPQDRDPARMPPRENLGEPQVTRASYAIWAENLHERRSCPAARLVCLPIIEECK